MRGLRTGSFRNTAALSVAILLAACLVAYFYSLRAEPPEASQNSADSAQQLVDTSLLQTAVSIAPQAATTDEQAGAREARRLADHELDLAFAWALRQAGAEAENATSHDSRFRELNNRIAQLKLRVEADTPYEHAAARNRVASRAAFVWRNGTGGAWRERRNVWRSQ